MGSFGPKRHTKSIGQQTEAVIIAKFLEVGYNVLIPYLGENLRYDLLIEDAEYLALRGGCVYFLRETSKRRIFDGLKIMSYKRMFKSR